MRKKNIAGENIKIQNANWSFRGTVPKNFDKHVKRSVPLYEWSHEVGLKVSDFFLPKKSVAYDLGCSTGTFLKSLSQRHHNKKIKLYGIDEIQNMLQIARKKNRKIENVKFIKSNLNKFKFKKCNLISAFYTIQFIHPSKRQFLIDKIFKNLNWGGGFIFFEKVRGPDARFQDMLNQMYSDYKFDNGYSAEEIFNKSKSLKGVLEPFSTKGNLDMLKRAGFKDCITIFKYLCFEGFLAIK
tara:strand:+ start:1320 stop:2039 length:720 start_codon:yes stop_codon:yes gene_type:complete